MIAACSMAVSRVRAAVAMDSKCTAPGANRGLTIVRCLPQSQFSERSGPVYVMERQTVYSVDGTCGPAHGNTVCNPSSTVYTGSCCSVGSEFPLEISLLTSGQQYGWCGNDAAFVCLQTLRDCLLTIVVTVVLVVSLDAQQLAPPLLVPTADVAL